MDENRKDVKNLEKAHEGGKTDEKLVEMETMNKEIEEAKEKEELKELAGGINLASKVMAEEVEKHGPVVNQGNSGEEKKTKPVLENSEMKEKLQMAKLRLSQLFKLKRKNDTPKKEQETPTLSESQPQVQPQPQPVPNV